MAKHALESHRDRLTVSYEEVKDESTQRMVGSLVVSMSLRDFDILNGISYELMGLPLGELAETDPRQAFLIARLGLGRVRRQHVLQYHEIHALPILGPEQVEQYVQALIDILPDYRNVSFDMEIGVYPSIQDAWVFEQNLSHSITVIDQYVPAATVSHTQDAHEQQ